MTTTTETRTCLVCGQEKDLGRFVPCRARDGIPRRGRVCYACRRLREKGLRPPLHPHGVPGARHASWKGDQAKPQTGRGRALRLYPLGPCERCGRPGQERHHKNGVTTDNGPENVAILCHRCHMVVDG